MGCIKSQSRTVRALAALIAPTIAEATGEKVKLDQDNSPEPWLCELTMQHGKDKIAARLGDSKVKEAYQAWAENHELEDTARSMTVATEPGMTTTH